MALTKIKLDSMVTGTLPDANIPDDITITGLSGTNSGDNAVNTNYSGLAVTSTSVTDGTNTFNKATDFVSATSGGTFSGGIDIDVTDDLRLRFLNGTFKGGIQVPTTENDMISGSAVDDLAIRSNANMLFSTGGNTERMRIDSSGNVMVGTTSTTVGGATSGKGFRVDGANGIVQACASGNVSAIFNRTSDDGAIVSLRKNGSEVGSIGNTSSDLKITGTDDIFFNVAGASDNILQLYGNNSTNVNAQTKVASPVYPFTDNSYDLGNSTERWKDIYLSGGAYLGGTGSANHLDDYEEGYHSYSITGSSGGTWTIRGGWSKFQYTKIGRIVTVSGKFETYGSSGTKAGELRISLPFTPVPSLDENAEVSCGTVALNRTGGGISNHMVAFLNGGLSEMSIMIHNESGGTETFVQASDCDDYIEGILSITYVAG